MHWALYKKEIDIGMVQALLRFKPRLDISDGTGKTVAQVANLRRLKLVEIENGTYDIQLFTQRALADPVVIKETQTLPEMDIRSYQPRWL
jgi:DNA-binding XRE family transcriptional regulator